MECIGIDIDQLLEATINIETENQSVFIVNDVEIDQLLDRTRDW
ncbi:hypothetical protein RCG23_23085 [Neobacillus sp. PS3-34]|nr:hypothetical protein [Neobacillus sp. PS3-34]WML48129.1 hypothetical protein RCG23_23085 [Neobacillus sp. PS3-34]